MARKWKHRTLGEFVVGDSVWERKMKVPAFAAFSYAMRYSNARRSTGEIRLLLTTWLGGDHLDEPTPGMISVAEKIVGDPSEMVRKVVAALWEDFNGRGPDSGMW